MQDVQVLAQITDNCLLAQLHLGSPPLSKATDGRTSCEQLLPSSDTDVEASEENTVHIFPRLLLPHVVSFLVCPQREAQGKHTGETGAV